MKKLQSSDLIPLEQYTISTALSADEIAQRLYLLTNLSGKKIRVPQSQKNISTYRGDVSKTGFKLSRYISYQNSFIPIIRGNMEPQTDKTDIRITMKLQLFVKVFMIIWLSLAGLASLVVLIIAANLLFRGRIHLMEPLAFIPVGMFIFGYLLMLLPFKLEAKKSKKELDLLFEAEPRSN